MFVLVGCEESQAVTKAFRDKGHYAYSCDIVPTRGNPNWHYQMDIVELLQMGKPWDLIILHPDCTAMACSGNRWYGKGKPKHGERIKAVEWTIKLWDLAKKYPRTKVVLENPKSVIFPALRRMGAEVHYFQPHDHGHGETKETGLALHNIEMLKPSNIVPGRENRVWKMAPGPNRKRDRSKTYDGVALAMAEQWG